MEEEKEKLVLARAKHRGDFQFLDLYIFRAIDATVGVQTLCTPLALLLWITSTNFCTLEQRRKEITTYCLTNSGRVIIFDVG